MRGGAEEHVRSRYQSAETARQAAVTSNDQLEALQAASRKALLEAHSAWQHPLSIQSSKPPIVQCSESEQPTVRPMPNVVGDALAREVRRCNFNTSLKPKPFPKTFFH